MRMVLDMKRLWRACLVLMAAVCIGLGGQGPAEAAPQVIEATGVYIMGDNDSPKIARDAARQEAMRAAVEKAGVYVESYSRTKNMQLTEDDVKMISGIDVIYTVQMMLYTQHIGSGTGKVTHAFEFKLVDTGKFEYVRMYALSPEYELMKDANFE